MFKLLRTLLILALIAWVGGFFVFMGRIPKQPEDLTSRTEVLVALTGGEERLKVATELLANKSATFLYISGVNNDVKPQELFARLNIDAQTAQCCVTLGYNALSTWENALEVNGWLREKGLKRIRLITSDYHMPRALAEFYRRDPSLIIVPHPVAEPGFDVSQWNQKKEVVLPLIKEYSKYSVVVVQDLLGSMY